MQREQEAPLQHTPRRANGGFLRNGAQPPLSPKNDYFTEKCVKVRSRVFDEDEKENKTALDCFGFRDDFVCRELKFPQKVASFGSSSCLSKRDRPHGGLPQPSGKEFQGRESKFVKLHSCYN